MFLVPVYQYFRKSHWVWSSLLLHSKLQDLKVGESLKSPPLKCPLSTIWEKLGFKNKLNRKCFFLIPYQKYFKSTIYKGVVRFYRMCNNSNNLIRQIIQSDWDRLRSHLEQMDLLQGYQLSDILTNYYYISIRQKYYPILHHKMLKFTET